MAWTKGQLATAAFEELALAGWEWDVTPEETQGMLRRLESMMATWAARGMACGYSFAGDPSNIDPLSDSGLVLVANEAVYMALAVRAAAGKGKQLAASTLASAKEAKDSLLSWVAYNQLGQVQYRAGTPSGAGNKPWRTFSQPFLPRPSTAPIDQTDAGGLDFNSN